MIPKMGLEDEFSDLHRDDLLHTTEFLSFQGSSCHFTNVHVHASS